MGVENIHGNNQEAAPESREADLQLHSAMEVL